MEMEMEQFRSLRAYSEMNACYAGFIKENQLKEKAVHLNHRIEGNNDMKAPSLWGPAEGYTGVPLTSSCSKWVYIC